MSKKDRNKRKAAQTNVQAVRRKTKRNYVNWAIGGAVTLWSVVAELRSKSMDPMNILLIGIGLLWVWIAIRYSTFSDRRWSVLRRLQRESIWWGVTGLTIGIFPCYALWAWTGTAKPPQFATPTELMSSVLQGKLIRVADLAMLDFTIRKRTFEDCDIYGPAIIHGVRCNMYDGVIAADPEGGFIKTSNQAITGAIVFEDCVFRKCRFYGIGFIDTPEGIDKMKSQFRLLPAQMIHGPADLNTALSAVMASQGQRLEKEYPLGYAVIASAGDKRMVLPRATRFEVDWDNLVVQRDEKNIMSIGFTHLREKEHNVTLKDLGMGMPAVLGLKSQLARFWKVAVYGECLYADSAGFVVALGFQEDKSPQE